MNVATLSPALSEKRALVCQALAEPGGRLAVAFSGGVDSTLLLALAVEARGAAATVAVTARSESLAQAELELCQRLARELGAELRLLRTLELERQGYRENSPNRCYFCKTELFTGLDAARAAGELADVTAVVYGATQDDLGDHRPGMQAAREHGVGAPLADAGLDKAEIRALSRELGLETWDKPAQPCLASRIPYGQVVTAAKLARIDKAEALLHGLGIREGRVRHHEESGAPLARVEVPLSELPHLVEPGLRERLASGLREAGFQYVTLDLEGFRSGRLNEVLQGKSLPIARANGGEGAP